MDNMLQIIVAADKKERENTQALEQHKSEIFQSLQEKKEQIFREHEAAARAEIETIRQREMQSADKKIAKLNERASIAMAALEAQKAQNTEPWADEIAGRILKRIN